MSVVAHNYLHLATSISVHNKRGIARHKKRISVHNGQESGHNGVYVYTKSPFLDITVHLNFLETSVLWKYWPIYKSYGRNMVSRWIKLEGVVSIDIDNPLVVFKSDGRMCIMNKPKAITFEEYADTITWRTVAERTKAKAVWEAAYRQGYKDGQATGGKR